MCGQGGTKVQPEPRKIPTGIVESGVNRSLTDIIRASFTEGTVYEALP